MFVVIGRWGMEPELAAQQGAGLSRLVDSVSQAPGLVKGYWTSNEDGTESNTFIIFEDRTNAESFARDVRENVENQERAGVHNLGIVVHEVAAQT